MELTTFWSLRLFCTYRKSKILNPLKCVTVWWVCAWNCGWRVSNGSIKLMKQQINDDKKSSDPCWTHLNLDVRCSKFEENSKSYESSFHLDFLYCVFYYYYCGMSSSSSLALSYSQLIQLCRRDDGPEWCAVKCQKQRHGKKTKKDHQVKKSTTTYDLTCQFKTWLRQENFINHYSFRLCKLSYYFFFLI